MIILDSGFVSATSVCYFCNKLFYKVKTESFIITNYLRLLQLLTTLHSVILHYATLRYITLRYVILRYFTLRYVILRYVTDPLLDVRCEGNLALWGVNVNDVDGTPDLNVIG